MKAVGKTDSERKTQSRERMKDMGLSSIQANIDQRTRERLISLCAYESTHLFEQYLTSQK